MSDPRAAYSQRLAERRAEIARGEQRHRILGYCKLVVVACGVVLVWLALLNRSISIVWVLIPAALLAALAIFHERVLRHQERLGRAVSYFEKALARLNGHWPGTGEPGDRYFDPAHPYAQDLDLFGKGSLFELLSTARTHIGEDTLARWLQTPAAPDAVHARHEAVNELRPRLDLREELAVLAEDARTGVDPASLAAWGEAPALLDAGRLCAAAAALTVLGLSAAGAILALLAWQLDLLQVSESTATLLRDFFLVAIFINSLFLYRLRKRVDSVVGAVDESAHELKLLAEVLVRIERETFRSPVLAALRASLDSEGDPPSKRLARLSRLMELLDSREHMFVRMIELFTFWTTHLAFAIENWRRHSGPAARRWLTATGEIEALCSLASHAFEHPGDPFPEFTPEAPGGAAPWLEAEAIGHPLIPEDRMVRNDVRIGGDLRLMVVSGSNMSGKSTLLRTLGINAVLAQAGAPVRARRLCISPLAVGASRSEE